MRRMVDTPERPMIFMVRICLVARANKLGLAAALIAARLRKRLDGATNAHGKT
jgi:hypothetical protein